MKTTLYRMVDKRERYYTLDLIGNLFGEYMLVCTYGSTQRAKPTRTLTKVYESLVYARSAYSLVLKLKQRRGYLPLKQN